MQTINSLLPVYATDLHTIDLQSNTSISEYPQPCPCRVILSPVLAVKVPHRSFGSRGGVVAHVRARG